jgi:DNA-binding transcriptional MerR regulator
MNRGFYHRDVLKIFPDIKARTLISWSEKGLIHPQVEPENRGGKRVYAHINLLEIAFIAYLLKFQIPFRVIRAWLDEARPHLESGGYLIGSLGLTQRIRSAECRVVETSLWPWIFEVIPAAKAKDVGLEEIVPAHGALVVNLGMLKKLVDESLERSG